MKTGWLVIGMMAMASVAVAQPPSPRQDGEDGGERAAEAMPAPQPQQAPASADEPAAQPITTLEAADEPVADEEAVEPLTAEGRPTGEAADATVEVVETPTPAEAAPPAAADEAAISCGARARVAAADAVVRVRSAERWGAGFVYGAPNRIVTSFSLLERGRPITVVARDGTAMSAQLLARVDRYDLAVLELREPVPGAEPLSPAPETSARVGAPVVVVGHPFGRFSPLLGDRGAGLLTWSLAQGTIGAVNDIGVQADVALEKGHVGAPLLDCEGRVLGVVTGPGRLDDDLGLVARIGHADDAAADSSGPGDFFGDLDAVHGFGASLIIDESGRVGAGVYLNLGVTLFDRLSWMTRVGIFMGGLDDVTGDVLSQERRLIRVSSLLGWRFLVDLGGFTTLYVVPAGGVSVTHRSIETERITVVPTDDPECMPSGTETCAMADILHTSDEGWFVRPALGLTFYFENHVGIGYTLELGLETAEVETHHLVRLEVAM